jgi:hypothetical protein
MSARPRKGRQVTFSREDGNAVLPDPDTVTGLRFTIAAQNGGEALVDFTALRPRRLALAVGRALRHLAAPAGPLGARSTVKAYAVAIPRFFTYLAEAGEAVAGVETLRARHLDGFECWLEAGGLTRVQCSGRSPLMARTRLRPTCAIGFVTSAPSPFNVHVRATPTAHSSRGSCVTPRGRM